MFGCGLAGGWRLVGDWRRLAGGRLAVAGGWLAFQSFRSSSIGPYCRSKQSFQAGIQGGRRSVVQGARWRAFKAGVGGGRSWSRTRGQFCDCTIHETAKTTPNTQNSRSSSTKTPILCSGRRGLAVGREDIGIGKRNRCLPANHRARFQNTNTS